MNTKISYLANYVENRAKARGEVRTEPHSMRDFVRMDFEKLEKVIENRSLAKKVLAAAILLPTLAVGVNYLDKKTSEYGSGCEVYQGYRENKAEGTTEFVFDESSANVRKGNPEFVLLGDSGLKNKLELKKNYCFIAKKSIWPFSREKIVETWVPEIRKYEI